MKYLPDPNLELLRLCAHDDLKGLVDVMTKDKGGLRMLETLTVDETYKKSKDDLPAIWDIVGGQQTSLVWHEKSVSAYRHWGQTELRTLVHGTPSPASKILGPFREQARQVLGAEENRLLLEYSV